MVGGRSDGLLVRRLWMKMVEEPCKMRVRSDSSAARSMVQRQGIGRVRRLDAALLWIQQKEKEKILTVSPIPTELNSAAIGAKGLTRNRLFGLLYMLKMVNSTGDRVGHEEYRELEHRERMRKGTQKVLKNKNLHVGLIWLLSNLQSVAGASTEEANNEGSDSWQWIWLFCTLIAALSLIEWLQHHLPKVTYVTWNYIKVAFNEMIKKIMKYKSEEKGMDDKATQADNWVDFEALAHYEAESNEMQNKLFQLDTRRDMALQECQLASEHSLKLMRQSLCYRVCRRGMKIHFCDVCPHFAGAEQLELCCKCVGEGSVSKTTHRSVMHT